MNFEWLILKKKWFKVPNLLTYIFGLSLARKYVTLLLWGQRVALQAYQWFFLPKANMKFFRVSCQTL